jgi:alpha-mannosidase
VRRGRGTIETTWPVNKVFQTNLLEDDGEEVPFKDGKFDVELGPF